MRFVRVIIDGKEDVRPLEYVRSDGRPMPKLTDCELEIIVSADQPSIIFKKDKETNLQIEEVNGELPETKELAEESKKISEDLFS
jgi:hypothetical protein